MAAPGRVKEGMDRIFAFIIRAEEREGIKCYFGNELWANAAKSQNTHMLANLRSQPYSPQRAAAERMALSATIEKDVLEYAKCVIEQIVSVPKAAVNLNFATCVAVKHGNIAILKLLLDNGADIEQRDSSGDTALTLAAKAGHEAVVRLLLQQGAYIEQRDGDGDTALTLAAKAGHEAVVRLLLQQGANIKQRDWYGDGDTALTLAAKAGHEAVARLLLQQGADIEQRDSDGDTALTLATKAGHEAVARLLLEQGADSVKKNITSSEQDVLRTAGIGRIQASKHKRRGLVKLSKYSSLRHGERRALGSDLIEAAKQGHENVVVQLLKESPLAYSERRALGSALIEAAKQGHENVVVQLLENSSLRYIESQVLGNALIEAAKHGHETVVMCFLRSINWSLNGTTIMSRSLFMAMQNGHSRVVDVLLSCIDQLDSALVVNSFDEYGRTLLHWAVESGDEKKVILLIEAGSSVAFLDNFGMSPLQLAAINGASPLELDAAVEKVRDGAMFMAYFIM